MHKKFSLALAVLVTLVVSGCEQQAKQEESPDTSVNILSETALPTNAVVMTTEAQSTASLELAVSDPTALPLAEPQALTSMAMDAATKPSIQQIQTALKNADFYHGKVDGVSGPQTKRAIRNFQSQNNLAADGKVGPKTWQKLQEYLNAAPSIDPMAEIQN